ncbi:unnamed protein product [Sphagnum jensenii]
MRWVLNLVLYMWVPLANCLNDGPIIDKMPSKVPMTWRWALSCSFHDRDEEIGTPNSSWIPEKELSRHRRAVQEALRVLRDDIGNAATVAVVVVLLREEEFLWKQAFETQHPLRILMIL